MNPFSLGNLRGPVKWLMAANGIVFIAQNILPGSLEAYFGLIPSDVLGRFQLWRLITYMFLHGSFLHILLNMFTLWMFGRELDGVWGSREFLKFYFICGLGAGLCNTIIEPFSSIPTIGASGAIYGLLVAYAMIYPSQVIYLYAIIPMRAKHFVMLIAVIEFAASFHGTSSTIARFAHLGGMLTGYLYLKSYEFRSFLNHFFQRVIDSIFVRKTASPKARKGKSEDIVKEVDRILEKVLLQGSESLTDEEREIMRRYSSKKH